MIGLAVRLRGVTSMGSALIVGLVSVAGTEVDPGQPPITESETGRIVSDDIEVTGLEIEQASSLGSIKRG